MPAPPSPTVSWGKTSTLGVLLTLAAAVGTTAAAVKGNDTATAITGIGAILTGLTTLGGRMAQAVALVRRGAELAGPWIDAAQAALAKPPQVTVHLDGKQVAAATKATATAAAAPPEVDLSGERSREQEAAASGIVERPAIDEDAIGDPNDAPAIADDKIVEAPDA